jgi:hypothetical protein
MPYKSDRRLYLTRDDKVVEEGDPTAAFLLVGEGGELEDSIAQQYGLANAPAEAKAVDKAPENKAVSKAPANKQSKE